MGDGTFTRRLTPVAVVGGLSFSQLSAGNHTCGRTPDGVAYCWGAGFDGEFGTGTQVNSATPLGASAGGSGGNVNRDRLSRELAAADR